MNRNETREIIKEFQRIQPAYTKWRQEAARANAKANGGDAGEEWSAILDSMARTLSTIDLKEGKEVIRRIEGNDLPVPPYGELALMVLREAKAGRQPATQEYDLQPRYVCLKCRDTGVVEVWNPHFVQSYREEFEKITRTPIPRELPADATQLQKKMHLDMDRFDPERTIIPWAYDPPNWLSLAVNWWRVQPDTERAIYHTALCICNCHRKAVLEQELRLWENGNRKTKSGQLAGPPACGAVRWRPSRQPQKTWQPYEDLFNWYQGGSNERESDNTVDTKAGTQEVEVGIFEAPDFQGPAN